MITIPRSLLRRVRSVFRRAGIGRRSTGLLNPVAIQTGSDGLRIRGISYDTAVEYHEPDKLPPTQLPNEELVLPVQFLEDCEGRTDEPVELEPSGKDQIAARFTDGGVPQLLIYPVEQKLDLDPKSFPAVPESVQSNEPRILSGLREALSATDQNSTRYALACIELGGSQGRVTATDGKCVYRQGGFAFPWTDDVLFSGAGVVRSGEFSSAEQVCIGRTADWVMLLVGPWKVWLRVNQDGRFPRIDAVFPDPANIVTRVQLAPEDIEFLRRGIERLPVTEDDPHRPVTVDLTNSVTVRAKSSDAPHPTELILNRSQVVGEPLVFVTSRGLLANALALGFRELCIAAPDQPVLCEDGPRQYLWSNLDPQEALAADEEAIRVESVAAGPQQGPSDGRCGTASTTQKRRRAIPLSNHESEHDSIAFPSPDKAADVPTESGKTAPVPRSSARRSRPAASIGKNPPAMVSPIEQAEALRATLRAALAQANHLTVALRRQRKQNRLMKSTLESLKELQRAAG